MVGKTYEGQISITVKGFGFVMVEGLETDIFVEAFNIKQALNKDTVKVKVLSVEDNGRLKGRVLAIVERGVKEVIGTYVRANRGPRVIPDDEKFNVVIKVKNENNMGAKFDDKVKVKIVDYIDKGVVLAQVTDVLGNKDLPGIDILSMCFKHGIDIDFSEAALEEAACVPDVVVEADITGRRDLRKENIFTIDGADAKDLDDAVGVKKLSDKRYELTVSIADVTHYIKEGTALDNDALARGTSVYLTDRVVPMIPKNLSNGICSLNPQVNRLTLTCRMELDMRGRVVHYEMFEAVIKTKHRMTYDDVTAILNGDATLRTEYHHSVPDFELMLEIAEKLKSLREERGSIEFDVREAKIIVDENGVPTEIKCRERQVSEEIIEEFMLLANETVAKLFVKEKLPFIYRVHEPPGAKKLQNLTKMMDIFGFNFTASEDVTPKELQLLLAETEKSKAYSSINKLMLRSMEKARYAPDNLGHFGLAATYYTHFTSPIRRYPDLMVHRIIRTFLLDQRVNSDEIVNHFKEIMPDIADKTSKKERGAIECERDVMSMKMAEYMMKYVGEEFDGVVSSVTKWGMYIELPNTVEGLIRLKDLNDDFYAFDEERMWIKGRRKGRSFKIGDSIRVIVKAASKEQGTIDFVVAGMKRDHTIKMQTGRLQQDNESQGYHYKKKNESRNGGQKYRSDRPRGGTSSSKKAKKR